MTSGIFYRVSPPLPPVVIGGSGGALHRVLIAAILLITLPFFGQSFHYMSHWPGLYHLSKAWPVIVVLLSLRGVLMAEVPLRLLFLVLLSYLVGVAPITSIANWDSGLLDALLTTVKVWSFSYYFALLAFLWLLKPPPELLSRCLLMLGTQTFVMMPLLWLILPAGWYSTDAVNAKFLLYDLDRGYRIYMPMFFGVLVIFYLARRLSQQREFWVALALLGCFALLILIYKQRMMIGAAAIVTVLALIPRRWRRITTAFALIIGVVAIFGTASSPTTVTLQNTLGGSLSVRISSLQSVLAHIGNDPFSWISGKGTTSRFADATIGEIIGNNYFFLADIGWVGIIFEYGLVGAALILAVYVAGFRLTRKLARGQGEAPFAMAVSDYMLFMIIQSSVYSLVFVPGEFASLLAVAVYLDRWGKRAAEPEPRREFPPERFPIKRNHLIDKNSLKTKNLEPPVAHSSSILFRPSQLAVLYAPSYPKTRQ